MSENKGRYECLLERIESVTTGGVEFPRNVLPDEACQ